LVSWSSGVILSQVSISSDTTYLSPVKSTSCLRKLSIITALMLSQDLLRGFIIIESSLELSFELLVFLLDEIFVSKFTE